MGTLSREATLLFPIFASRLIRDQLFKKRICSFKIICSFKRAALSREVNRKSQKLFPFVKIIENHGGVLVHLNIYGRSLIIFCCNLGKGDNFIRILFAVR